MDTLALNSDWDISVDQYGNIATFGTASSPAEGRSTPLEQTGAAMRMAQDVATRCLSWRGEVYYDTTQGVRYDKLFGAAPNMSLIQNSFSSQALAVPEVAQAIVDFAQQGRVITGTLTTTDIAGNTAQVFL